MTITQEHERNLINLRRSKVLELLSKGYTNQAEIARTLNISEPTVSRDISFLKEQAKRELRTHIQDRLPYEFARSMAGINDILRRATDMLDKTTDPKLQHQYMTLLMQLYGTIMNMATDGGIISEAFRKVEQLNSKNVTGDIRLAENYTGTAAEPHNAMSEGDEESDPIEPEEDLQEE